MVTAVWVAAGTAAGALGAWQLASADSGGAAHSRPLDEGAVRRALADTPNAPSASPSPTRTPAPSASASASPSPSRSGPAEPTRRAVERSTVRFTGGTATVECRSDGTVRLISWSPADGYHIDDDVTRGPAATARLEAEANDDDERDDLTYEIRCTSSGPHARAVPEADD
ncbi:hypothetical protein STRAU_0583 [Streptomyces aurantiacus JA 4570]|uniref:Uncharacterized protein n=1 Tax=Streptomyces aurantiacus JA 4570 TaxID=1286094 RepID=S3ZT28_9ACTN|nr:hypothetical protein STRAU_0583 [Streptomyces aurantiacus JA 4570]